MVSLLLSCSVWLPHLKSNPLIAAQAELYNVHVFDPAAYFNSFQISKSYPHYACFEEIIKIQSLEQFQVSRYGAYEGGPMLSYPWGACFLKGG